MLANLVNLFFPQVCAGCDQFLNTGEYIICTQCRHDIPMTNHHRYCDNEAYEKFYGKLPVCFASALCYFHKKGVVHQMIHKLKYGGQEEIGTALGYWYAEELKNTTQIDQIDAIIPVPLHKRRRRERGYNQVSAFGKALSDGLGIPFNEQILVRNIYSQSQTRKNRAGRSANSKSVFDIVYNIDDEHKHYLLIDDVLTTGATLEACGRALLQIEGVQLSIVCIAMAK